MKINLLIVQLESITGDIDSNIKKAEKLFDNCNAKSADLILFPELWTTGWDCPNFNRYSESFDSSKFVAFLKKLAIKYNSNVIGGSSVLRNNKGKDRNTCLVINRKGEILNTYDKLHLFSHRGEAEGNFLEEGDTPVIAKTDIGKIGISICYDIRFPELFRLYAFNGVDFIVNMAAWPLPIVDEYEVLARARAIENQTFVITSLLTGKINDKYNFSGNSMVIDYRGHIIAKLEEEETILQAQIDTDTMVQYREQMPILSDTKKTYQILEK